MWVVVTILLYLPPVYSHVTHRLDSTQKSPVVILVDRLSWCFPEADVLLSYDSYRSPSFVDNVRVRSVLLPFSSSTNYDVPT